MLVVSRADAAAVNRAVARRVVPSVVSSTPAMCRTPPFSNGSSLLRFSELGGDITVQLLGGGRAKYGRAAPNALGTESDKGDR